MGLIILLSLWLPCGLIAAWQTRQRLRQEGYKPGAWYRFIVLLSIIGGPLVFAWRAFFNKA